MATAGKNSIYLSAELAAAVDAAREADPDLTLGTLVRRGLAYVPPQPPPDREAALRAIAEALKLIHKDTQAIRAHYPH